MRASTRKTAAEPRKRPLQERSRATFAAILEAAARVFVDEGLERATTNRIAEVASVSIGSLYQYFPNKDALVATLLERHLAQAVAARPVTLAADVPLAEAIAAAVEWHLAVHAAEPALHQELTTHAARVAGAERMRAFERMHQEGVRRRLERHRAEIRPRDVDLAAFVVSACLEAVTHAAVVQRPELLATPELASELRELLLRYLRPDGAGLA
jgi:AcrR family transcriptional regulator